MKKAAMTMLAAAMLCGGGSLTGGEDRKSPEKLAVLTVGNSFADSVFAYFPQVAQSAGRELVLERCNLGGCSLERHWNLALQSEQDPAFKPYGGESYSLKDKLCERKWDIVTIQQVSDLSWQPHTFFPYAENLRDYIKKYAPDAEVVLQQTWAYRNDDSRLQNWGIDQRAMYERVCSTYADAAKKLGSRVIPTGEAVQLARETQTPAYVPYDPAVLETMKYPDAMPDRTGSLVNGLGWRRDQQGQWHLGNDPFHLNRRGEYLQSCVWYGYLFGAPTSEIVFVPDTMTPEDAAFMRETAQKVLDAHKK